jgi:hypothetical protein
MSSYIDPKNPRSMSALARSIFPERAKQQDQAARPTAHVPSEADYWKTPEQHREAVEKFLREAEQRRMQAQRRKV